MTTFTKLLFAAASLAIFATYSVSAAQAATITANRDAFIASLPGTAGTLVDEDLEDEAQTTTVLQSITLSGSGIQIDVTSGASNAVTDFSVLTDDAIDTLSDDGTTLTLNVPGTELDLVLDDAATDPTVFTFTLPGSFNAISFDYDGVNDSAPLVFFSAGNSSTQTAVNSTLLLDPSEGAGFFGYVDDTPGASFTSFTLTHSSVFGGNTTQESFDIGRITLISTAVVPVPASIWLLGSALGLLGWLRRRAP